jgi:hypothetical protein
VNPPLVIDNKMAVEADPGPFKLAAAEKLEAFGPLLVVLPDNGFVNVVLVELSHLHVCHREQLKLDSHSMTHLSSAPGFEEMRAFSLALQRWIMCPTLLLFCAGKPVEQLERSWTR